MRSSQSKRNPPCTALQPSTSDIRALTFLDSFSEEDQERVLAYLAGERTLQILYDKFFQKVLSPTCHPERLQSLMSAVFGQSVEIVEILSREEMTITEAGSQVVMDIIIKLLGGDLVTVEIQRIGYLFPGERSSCYDFLQ